MGNSTNEDNPHPLLPTPPQTKPGPLFEDLRTEEDIERDRQRAAEERTYQMFDEPPPADSQPRLVEQTIITPDTETLTLVPRGIVTVAVIPPVVTSVVVYDRAVAALRAGKAFPAPPSVGGEASTPG